VRTAAGGWAAGPETRGGARPRRRLRDAAAGLNSFYKTGG
jgi:hypothetical protein